VRGPAGGGREYSLETFRLRDRNPGVVEAWRQYFADCRDVTVSAGDIFAEPADAVVSPANSFGFMDGGIDMGYSLRFGWHVQDRLQALLHAEHDTEAGRMQFEMIGYEWEGSEP
jgi:hypothetical protein